MEAMANIKRGEKGIHSKKKIDTNQKNNGDKSKIISI